jgi:protein tyrosine phosphatase (PTP) superfamily phosphohydrolase (DUF442 family)
MSSAESSVHHGTLSAEQFEVWLHYHIVIFTSATCGRCRSLASQLPATLPLRLEWLSADDAPQLALQFDVTQLPTALLFRDGRPIAREFASPDSLLKLVALARSPASLTTEPLSVPASPAFLPVTVAAPASPGTGALPDDVPSSALQAVTEDVLFAGQPSHYQLQNIHKVGIKSVINLRDPADPQYLVGEDRDVIEHARLPYIVIPLQSANDIDAAIFDRIVAALDSSPKPVLVHCRTGVGAGSVVLAREAINSGNASFADFIKWCLDLDVPVSARPVLYQTCMAKINAANQKTA